MLRPHRCAWQGYLTVQSGRGLYLGPAYRTRLHAHHALQICIALGRPLRVRQRDGGPWRCYAGAAIAADEPHALDGRGDLVALVYLDPESHLAFHFFPALARRRIVPIAANRIAAAAQELREWWKSPKPIGAAAAMIDKVLAALAPPARPSPELFDARVARAIQLLRTAVAADSQMSAAELAAAVGLSPSRLAHVFRQVVGLPIRRYRLWLRLETAVRERVRGHSLTAAAHAAGFSDSAHLARTFQRMLGIKPSDLQPTAASSFKPTARLVG